MSAGRFFAGDSRRGLVFGRAFFAGGSRRPLHPGGGQGRLWYWVCLGSGRWWWFGSCGAMLRPASAFSGESGSCLAPRVATRGNTPPDPLTTGLRPAYAVAPLPLSRLDRGGSPPASVCIRMRGGRHRARNTPNSCLLAAFEPPKPLRGFGHFLEAMWLFCFFAVI